MLIVRVAHFKEWRNTFIVVPFAATFAYRSANERQDILARLVASIGKKKRGRIDGTTLIAWLADGTLQYTASPGYAGPLPNLNWLELMSRLNAQIYCDDAVILSQLAPAEDHRPSGSKIA